MKRRIQLEAVNITADQHRFVRQRVEPLILQHTNRPLIDLLGDAYCQGLTDAADAAAGRETAP